MGTTEDFQAVTDKIRAVIQRINLERGAESM